MSGSDITHGAVALSRGRATSDQLDPRFSRPVRAGGLACLALSIAPLLVIAPHARPEMAILSITWLVVWLSIAGLCLTRRLDRTHPLAWCVLAMLVMYVVHPYAVFRSHQIDEAYHFDFDLAPTYKAAIWLGLLATASIPAGYAFVAALIPAPSGSDQQGLAVPQALQKAEIRLVRLAAWATLGLALGGYSLYSISVGESPITALLAGARKISTEGSSAYLYLAPQLLGPSAALFLVGAWARGKWPVMAVVLLLTQVNLFVPTGQRFVLFTSAVPVIILALALKGRRTPLALFFAISVVGLITIVSLRDVGTPASTGIVDEVEQTIVDPGDGLDDLTTGADTEMIDALALELQVVPGQLNYVHGSTLASTLAAPVPRAFWSAKPVTADGYLNQYLFGVATGNASVAYGFAGELYYDSGPIGISAGMFALGGACLLLRRFYQRHRADALAIAVYLSILPITVSLLRGSLGLILGRALFTVVPLIVVFIVARRRRGSTSPDTLLTTNATRPASARGNDDVADAIRQ